MPDFVERGPVPVDRFEIGLRRRHLHEIVPRIVERPLATDPEIHAGCADQRLGLRQDEVGFVDRLDDIHNAKLRSLELQRIDVDHNLPVRSSVWLRN